MFHRKSKIVFHGKSKIVQWKGLSWTVMRNKFIHLSNYYYIFSAYLLCEILHKVLKTSGLVMEMSLKSPVGTLGMSHQIFELKHIAKNYTWRNSVRTFARSCTTLPTPPHSPPTLCFLYPSLGLHSVSIGAPSRSWSAYIMTYKACKDLSPCIWVWSLFWQHLQQHCVYI